MATNQTASAIDEIDLSRTPLEQVLATLNVEVQAGLSDAEADARLQRFGPNEVPERTPHALRQFLKKFWGLSAWMLELIIVLSWVLGKSADVVVVSGLLLVNALVSVMQERRASAVIDALRRQLQVTARVRRRSAWQLIAARRLVPGDIVRLRSGDFVPADARLLTGELSVDQSALTGARTYFGRTTELVQRARPKLHVEAVVSDVVSRLFVIVGLLVAMAMALSIVRGFPLLELLPLALVLFMSAIPVALPVMFTVSTAVGSLALATKGVLVTRLSALEDAAMMDVLCVDKTGTITRNRLTVTGVVAVNGFTPQDVLTYGALASEEANQDPIDLAFLAAARQPGGVEPTSVIRTLQFIPFDPRTRRTEALIEQDGRRIRVMKGAVPVVAQACGLDRGGLAELEAQARTEAGKGSRVLAVARGNPGHPPL
ncbi:MAG TPA: HAD-IC family P-type ATPase [Alphaproteobacteria bacterium]|nr:HAD-IC family P-type ATPase [Alphaproteobacteria bacterium]